MPNRYAFITKGVCFLPTLILSSVGFSQPAKYDTFTPVIVGIQADVLVRPVASTIVPDENAIRDFESALRCVKEKSYDSCASLLAKYQYTISEVTDGKSGAVYDVIRESRPVRRGWGTFIHNRQYAKRLLVEIDHPVDDSNSLTVGAELFRKTQASWLLVAGTGKKAGNAKTSADAAQNRRLLFQRAHETLSDVTVIAVSIHGFNKEYFEGPVSTADIVLSNGTTTDEQWGISQISLQFRDSLKSAGFAASLAMFDSGYASIAGNVNPQGIWSNDSLGFGHWMNVELSNTVRESPASYGRFIEIAERALDMSGRKVAHLVNNAFGLVSPRVLKVDAGHPLSFPPAGGTPPTYRIISFSDRKSRTDTMNLRVGQWIDLFKSEKSLARIRRQEEPDTMFADDAGEGASVVTSMARVAEGIESVPSILRIRPRPTADSIQQGDGEGPQPMEPLQVHRIPLQPIVVVEGTDQNSDLASAYRWSGVVHAGFSSSIPVFTLAPRPEESASENPLADILIPLLRNSYGDGKSKFVGIQMTKVLVEQIARLVTEQNHGDADVSLVAEQAGDGDYFLRLVPSAPASTTLADLKK